MTTRFHINGKGNPGRCEAQAGRCPLGTSDEHYDSAEGARAAFEAAQDAVPEIVSRRANRSAMGFQEFDPRSAPLTEEEEEALLPDDDDDPTDTRAPVDYRGMSESEVNEIIREQWQEEQYARENQTHLWAHRWD